jgi:hypothetical protein
MNTTIDAFQAIFDGESEISRPARLNNLSKYNLMQPEEVDKICSLESRDEGLVSGLVARHSVSILIGDSGLGKSPLAYQLGICVAQGMPFLGMGTEPGPVVYADYENGLKEGQDLRNNLVKFLGLPKAPDNFMVWTPDCAANLDIEGICKDIKPSLFIIDSLRAYNPSFEKTDSAGKEISSLRSTAYKCGLAILLIHHVRKPGQDGVPSLDDDSSGLMVWLNQAAGHRSIVNQSDTRIAADLSRSQPESAMVLRWHRRLCGEGGPLYLERISNDEGDPIGYAPITGPKLLANPDQQDAFARLPQNFTFKEAKVIYQRADDPTRKWLLKCVAAGIVRQTRRGLYERL